MPRKFSHMCNLYRLFVCVFLSIYPKPFCRAVCLKVFRPLPFDRLICVFYCYLIFCLRVDSSCSSCTLMFIYLCKYLNNPKKMNSIIICIKRHWSFYIHTFMYDSFHSMHVPFSSKWFECLKRNRISYGSNFDWYHLRIKRSMPRKEALSISSTICKHTHFKSRSHKSCAI